MKNVLYMALLMSTSVAFAGANNVQLICNSADHSLRVEAYFPGDMAESNATVQLGEHKFTYMDDGQLESYRMNNEDPNKLFPWGFEVDKIESVDRIDRHQVSLSVSSKEGAPRLQVQAIANTVTWKRGKEGQRQGKFKANITAADPSKATPGFTGTVSCKYDYSL